MLNCRTRNKNLLTTPCFLSTWYTVLDTASGERLVLFLLYACYAGADKHGHGRTWYLAFCIAVTSGELQHTYISIMRCRYLIENTILFVFRSKVFRPSLLLL